MYERLVYSIKMNRFNRTLKPGFKESFGFGVLFECK